MLKLAINISLAVQTLAFSEGLLLAERAGVDPELAAEVMSDELDRLADAEGEDAAAPRPPRDAWFDVELMHKDIRLALRDGGRAPGSRCPSAAVADQMLTEGRDLGYGHRDLAALHDVLAKTADRSMASDPAMHGAPVAPCRRSRRALAALEVRHA